jgi:hypothetical protein
MVTLRSLERWVADNYKPTMPPARNAIDALLDGGAIAAPNAPNARVKEADQAHGHATSSPAPSPAHTYAALDAKLKTIDAKASEAPSKPAKRRKKLDSSYLDYNPDGSDIDDDEDVAQDPHKQQPEKKAKRVKSLASDQGRGNASLGSDDESEVAAHTVKTAVEDKAHNARESATAQEAHKLGGKKASHVSTNTAPVAKAGKAKATPQLASLSQPLVAEPSGRPVRKAKKTALGKLKAKRGKENDDSMSDTDDESESEDNGSSFGAKDDKPHVAVRGRPKAHLPTPVTKSATSKRDGTSKPSGKLRSVKSKAPPTTASVKKVPGNTATNTRTRRDTSLIGEGSVVNSTERESDAPGNKSRRKTLATADDDEQNEREGESPARRPGALKRPARSASRGRVPLREIRYDFHGSTPRVKRKKRSVSRASVKPGATRQRMQSESVNHHYDPKKDDSRQLSTSRRAAPKEIEIGSPPRKKSTTQNKSKELHPQPKPSHNNKSALQSKHTGVAAKAGTQKNATTAKSTIARHKPGSSQGNAIMIEQASQTNSSPSSSPHQDTMARPNAANQNKHRPDVQRLQTPAVMPSSPPAGGSKTVHTLAKDRPTIIAFSKRGPRNQGISSASKDLGSGFAPAAAHARGTTDVGTSGLRDQGKDLARTLFSTQEHAPITMVPSNVSVSVDETFADFTNNGKNKALTSLLQRQTAAAPKSIRRKSEPEQQCDKDDGFFVIDDFDDTTLVDEDTFSEKENVPRTASQIAMPPPNGPEKIFKATSHKTLLDKPVKTVTKPAIANPIPEPQKPKKAVLATTKKTAIETEPAKPATKVESKNDAKFAPIQKAAKTVPLKDVVDTRFAKVTLAEQKAQPKRKRELNEIQPGSPEKKTKTSQMDAPKASSSDDVYKHQLRSSKVPQGAKVVIAKPVERPDRRRNPPNRRTTQGSQGVDILGSPYPKELEVPIQATALEIFSQQANLSSDQMLSSDAVVPGGLAGRLNLAAVPRILPPTHRKPISSNDKPLPAAPDESSRAATRIASGPLAEQLITARHEQSVMDDPFTSSHGNVPLAPIVKQKTQKLDFKQALRKHGIIIDRQERATNRDEDPDKTLVDPAKDLGSDSPRDVASSTSGASDELSNASSVSAAQKALENVGDWRNTLKPHQTHLFDSLVIASHRIVRHMVDSETAKRDIVADYRRQGEIVVTELERAHTTEFQQYATGMQELKKRAADRLASIGKRLKMDVKEAERVREERREARVARDDGFDGMPERLVAGLG